MHRVGGTRDGVFRIPQGRTTRRLKPLVPGQVDFKHYHGLEETIALLKGWAEQYPDLVDLYIGRPVLRGARHLADHDHEQEDREGHRQARVLPRGRPARRRDQRGRDDAVLHQPRADQLRDRPRDHAARGYQGALLQAEQQPRRQCPLSVHRAVAPQHGSSQRRRRRRPDRRGPGGGPRRRRVRPADAEVRRGGQGNATQGPEGRGRAHHDAGPQGEGDYVLYPEGVDNDGDGRYNEDGIGGLDLHRNYPGNWRPMRRRRPAAGGRRGALASTRCRSPRRARCSPS